MEKIKDKLSQYGLAATPTNVGIGFAVFQGLSIVSTFGGWALCYKLLGRPVGTRMLARFDTHPKYNKSVTWLRTKTEGLKYLKKANGERLLISFAMNKTCCLFLLPVLIPLELALVAFVIRGVNDEPVPMASV